MLKKPWWWVGTTRTLYRVIALADEFLSCFDERTIQYCWRYNNEYVASRQDERRQRPIAEPKSPSSAL